MAGAATNMSGIATLAAAAAATSKITTMPSVSTTGITAMAGGQQHHAIKVLQQPGGGQQLVTSQGVKVTPMQQGQAMIGGQTVRLASPGGTLLKTAGTTITSQVKETSHYLTPF